MKVINPMVHSERNGLRIKGFFLSSQRTFCLRIVVFLLLMAGFKNAQAQALLYEDFGSGVYSNATVNGANQTMYAPIGFGATGVGNFSISTINVPPGETQSLQGSIDFNHIYVPPVANGVFQIEVASQYAPGGQAGGGTVEPIDASAYSTNGALSLELYASVSTTFDIFIGDIDNHIPPSGPWAHETEYLTPLTIPAGVWTNLILPLDTNAGHWDSNLNTIVWNSITEIFIDAQAPPCLAVFPGGNYPETINYGTIEFIPNPSGPTPTPVFTPVYNCSTPTPTATPTITPTNTSTPTQNLTSTITFTATQTFTITNTPTITTTPNPTPVPEDIFYVNQNLFNSSNGSVSIYVAYNSYPGDYRLWIYNSAGELIKKMDTQQLSAPISKSYLWDGTNTLGNKCASGVYILYLIEPFSRKTKRVLLIH